MGRASCRPQLRPAAQAQQARLRGAIDVGIENADLETDGLQAEREVDGRGRLADPALAGRDGDHVLDAGNLRWLAAPAAGRRAAGSAPAAPPLGARLLHPGAFRSLPAARRAAAAGRSGPPASRPSAPRRTLTPRHLAHDLLGGLAQGLELGARSAGTVIENETRPSFSRISETNPRSTMLPSMSGPLTRRKRSRTWSLLGTHLTLFTLAGAVDPRPGASTV